MAPGWETLVALGDRSDRGAAEPRAPLWAELGVQFMQGTH